MLSARGTQHFPSHLTFLHTSLSSALSSQLEKATDLGMVLPNAIEVVRGRSFSLAFIMLESQPFKDNLEEGVEGAVSLVLGRAGRSRAERKKLIACNSGLVKE